MKTISFKSVSTEGAIELPAKANSQGVYSASNKMQVKEFANACIALAIFGVRFKMIRSRATAIINIDYGNRYKSIQIDVNATLVNIIIQALSGSLLMNEIKEFLAKESADEDEESFTNIGEELFRLSVLQQRRPEEASDFITEDGTVSIRYTHWLLSPVSISCFSKSSKKVSPNSPISIFLSRKPFIGMPKIALAATDWKTIITRLRLPE